VTHSISFPAQQRRLGLSFFRLLHQVFLRCKGNISANNGQLLHLCGKFHVVFIHFVLHQAHHGHYPVDFFAELEHPGFLTVFDQ
jgi:hypothetical protein